MPMQSEDIETAEKKQPEAENSASGCKN